MTTALPLSTTAALLLCLLAACAGPPKGTRSQPMTSEDEPPYLEEAPDEPAQPPDEDLFEPTWGEWVTREALYRVQPVAGGKRLQAVTLEFDDGESWIRAYRPLRSELKYADKRVVVTGRPYTPSPRVQHVAGTHFDLESIELAPGETPWDPEPSLVPPPPFARTAAEAKARAGRHVQCRGVAEGESFRFVDGSELPLLLGSWYDVPPIEGDQTVLAWVDEDGSLHARGACPGEVARCGMTDDNMHD